MTIHTRIFFAMAIASSAAGFAHAQSVVDLTGGRLSLTTPNGDQAVKVVVEPVGGATRVFGFAGIPDGREFFGVTGISVTTGSGKDKVEIDVQSAQSLDVRLDTQGGDSETLVKWKALGGIANAVGNIDIASATTGVQTAKIEIDSELPSATFAINAPSASELEAKVQSSNVSDFLRVALNSRAPKTGLEVSSNASALEVDIVGGARSRPSELKVALNQNRPAAASVTWGIDSGAGDDLIEAVVNGSGSTITQRGSILTRGGNDTVKIVSDGFGTTTGTTIDGGPGNDYLSQEIKGRFLPSQSLQTRMLGRDGSDQLIVTTDTGIFGTGLPKDLFPIINCGAGVDRFNAFGQISGCESRL